MIKIRCIGWIKNLSGNISCENSFSELNDFENFSKNIKINDQSLDKSFEKKYEEMNFALFGDESSLIVYFINKSTNKPSKIVIFKENVSQNISHYEYFADIIIENFDNKGLITLQSNELNNYKFGTNTFDFIFQHLRNKYNEFETEIIEIQDGSSLLSKLIFYDDKEIIDQKKVIKTLLYNFQEEFRRCISWMNDELQNLTKYNLEIKNSRSGEFEATLEAMTRIQNNSLALRHRAEGCILYSKTFLDFYEDTLGINVISHYDRIFIKGKELLNLYYERIDRIYQLKSSEQIHKLSMRDNEISEEIQKLSTFTFFLTIAIMLSSLYNKPTIYTIIIISFLVLIFAYVAPNIET